MDRKISLPCSRDRILEIWRSSIAAFAGEPTPLEAAQLQLFSPGTATNKSIGESSWIEFHRDSLLQIQSQNEEECIRRLDDATSTFIDPKFYVKEEMENDIGDRAMTLLSRLPKELLQQSISLLGDFGRDFVLLDGQIQCTGEPKNLKTLDLISTNVIRMALLLALMDGKGRMILSGFGRRFGRGWQMELQRFINAVASLIAAIREFGADSGDCKNTNSLLQETFLYNMWQQSLALFFSWTLQNELHGGYAHYRRYNFRVIPSPSQSGPCSRADANIKCAYMCCWAYRMLQSHSLSRFLTFQGFHTRYNEVFGDLPARCFQTARTPCIGSSPYSCGRFVGSRTPDQSTHDPMFCLGQRCKKYYWDRESYVSKSGGRAVSIQETGNGLLKYTKASETTMAVSHVWNHGQGGRPETGLNACLHERYSYIAIKSGFSSYWMDTPCIPSEHKLRQKAIREINNVFMHSNMTLVCDKDIMKIDIKDLTIKIRESLLAALLVCDWNTRSWTLLEAIRADHNIQLLCKDNRFISLKENLDVCNRDGSLDIATLFLTARHLIPRKRTRIPDPNECNSSDSDNDPEPFRKFELEEAAVLLSNRVASRPGDEIVIWSLLCGDDVFDDAASFWASLVGNSLSTSFLLSSAPRLQNIPGFSWAPLRPDLEKPSTTAQNSFRDGERFLPFPALTDRGEITSDGLKADWAVCIFEKRAGDMIVLENKTISTSPQLSFLSCQYIGNQKYGALLQCSRIDANKHLIIPYQGEAAGQLVGIVASGNCMAWKWIGVYAWKEVESLPDFRFENILIT
jgi:hypothetical protein